MPIKKVFSPVLFLCLANTIHLADNPWLGAPYVLETLGGHLADTPGWGFLMPWGHDRTYNWTPLIFVHPRTIIKEGTKFKGVR